MTMIYLIKIYPINAKSRKNQPGERFEAVRGAVGGWEKPLSVKVLAQISAT
jgi:hypothetical protein